MRKRAVQWAAMSFVTSLILCLCAAAGVPPAEPYLVWSDDPSTTINVQYQTLDHAVESRVEYGAKPGGSEGYESRATGERKQIPGLSDGRYIHCVRLKNLQPGATYYFRTPLSTAEYKFSTLPESGPIRFIEGGDMGILPATRKLLELAAARDPMFGLLGGDLAYANGDLHKVHLWDIWLRNWTQTMVTSDGRLIPMVLAIGNHELNEKEGPPEQRAPFYFGFFEQGGKSYFSRRLGQDTLLLILDSGHAAPHDGDQAVWLEETLKANKSDNVLAAYHVPLFPSHRSFDDARSVLGRRVWQPLFDQLGVDLVFEHHDHTFKRSKRIRGLEQDDSGIVYMGDGCLGMVPREITDPLPWYLEKASSTAHFWLVNIDHTEVTLEAIDLKNEPIDAFTLGE